MSTAYDPTQLLLNSLELSTTCSRCAELAKLAYFDQLTGLANRFVFQTRMDHVLAYAEQNDSRFAVLFIDLDDFKSVNDSLGHDAGDTLLQLVGERICSSVRENDLVARYGGDEFAILLEDLSTSPLSIAERVSEAVRTSPFPIKGEDVYISVSIGIAAYPVDAATSLGLLQRADSAMYSCKGNQEALLKVGS